MDFPIFPSCPCFNNVVKLAYEVNIIYELSHKLNDVVNVKMNSYHEVETEVGIPHTYKHTNIVHND
jgi:hypothetical protein